MAAVANSRVKAEKATQPLREADRGDSAAKSSLSASRRLVLIQEGYLSPPPAAYAECWALLSSIYKSMNYESQSLH